MGFTTFFYFRFAFNPMIDFANFLVDMSGRLLYWEEELNPGIKGTYSGAAACCLGPTEADSKSEHLNVNERKQSENLSVPPPVVFVHSVLAEESGGS